MPRKEIQQWYKNIQPTNFFRLPTNYVHDILSMKHAPLFNILLKLITSLLAVVCLNFKSGFLVLKCRYQEPPLLKFKTIISEPQRMLGYNKFFANF